MPEIKRDPAAARPETVTVYDPQREQVVDVPASQAKLLVDAGYKVGPEAEYEAKVQGLPGKVASFMMGAANGGTFGQFQHLVPKSLRGVQRQVEAAHPVLHGVGEMATAAPLTAAAPGGIYGRVAASAAQGAGEEMARAVKFNQPIAAERMLQGAGIGAFLGLAGEGVAAGAKAAVPAARRALGVLEAQWPREMATTVEKSGQWVTDVGGYKNPLADSKAWDMVSALPGTGSFGFKVTTAAKNVTKVLNNLGATHSALDAIQAGPMKALATTTRALIQGSTPLMPLAGKDIDAEYARKSAHVSRAAADPQGLQAWLEATYGHALKEHPELQQQLMVRAQMAATVLNEHLPKDPNDPAVQSKAVNPPRSAKLEWLRQYHGIDKPLEALQNPTPGVVQTIEEVHPETVHLVRQALTAYAMSPEGQKMTPTQARRISIILGGPVRPQNSQGYVQRLAQTHAEAAVKQQAQASTSGSKPGTSLDATNPMKLMMGQ